MGVALAFSLLRGVMAQDPSSKDKDAQPAPTVESAAKQEQDARDKELEAIKKRLEALEQEKAKRDAQDAASDEHGSDPAADKWYDRVKIGGGIRSSFRSLQDAAPNGRTASYGFQLDDARLYTGGKIIDIDKSNISATLNADFSGAGASIIDAIAQFNIQDEINVWAGRLLPACDRQNFDGPYYIIAWDFPETSIAFNNATKGFGRDDGVTVWGDVHNFKYWAGAYSGANNTTQSADHLLYAARVQYDLWDQEKGYYLLSTNYGAQSLLAFGASVNYQSSTSGTVADTKNTVNFEVDGLFEKKFEFGVPTVEMAYYHYGRGGFGGPDLGGLGNATAAGTGVNSGTLGQGNAFAGTVAWLIPHQIGWGEFQPLVRYQAFEERSADVVRNPVHDTFTRWDLGTNYVISGHNASISVLYTALHENHPVGAMDHHIHLFTIGTQVQF